MLHKTTSFIFSKYGDILNEISQRNEHKLSTSLFRSKDKSISSFYVYNQDIYIKVISGIAMLVVSLDDTGKEYEQFVIHRVIRLKKGVRFNFLSISSSIRVEISYTHGTKSKTIPTYENEKITYERIIPRIEVKEIFGYYYQVRNPNYNFAGESHNFWELSFIDSGSLDTTVDDEPYTLNSMDLILYAPGQYHTQSTKDKTSCSYLTILFDMDMPHPEFIINRVYNAQRDIHAALNNFIKVSSAELLYDDELMLCYLKELIIKILQYDFLSDVPVASSPMQQKFENELLNNIIIYINEHIYEQLTIEEICHKFSISRSSLQTLFKNNVKVPPKQYISDLKLNKSKILIKESVYTISEISNILGFTSIHYFSRKFKQRFGIAPTDYAKTIYN